MNPIYQYIIYAIFALILFGILSYKLYRVYQERSDIKLSKNLGGSFKFGKQDESTEEVEEEINEIRVPRQAELNLTDENEGKLIVLHLAAKLDKKPELSLIKQKLSVNDMVYKNGYFESEDSTHHKGFKILNGEKPGKFDELKTISLLTLVLHLKGQRNVTKTFDEMLKLGRKISEAFDMQLLDDDFNALSEQSISNYRETTNNIDLKTGAYVS